MHLVKGLTMTKHNGENYLNGSWFNYQAECIMIIDSKPLVKAFGSKSCLVTS